MNWKVLASDSVSLAFREAIKFYNSLWEKGLGPYPPYVAGEYVWQNIRLIPGTNIIILIPYDYQDGTYGVIGEFDGWKYVQPILNYAKLIVPVHFCLPAYKQSKIHTPPWCLMVLEKSSLISTSKLLSITLCIFL